MMKTLEADDAADQNRSQQILFKLTHYWIHCCADEFYGAHKQAWFNLLEKVSEHTNTSVMTLISVLTEVENRIGDLFFFIPLGTSHAIQSGTNIFF